MFAGAWVELLEQPAHGVADQHIGRLEALGREQGAQLLDDGLAVARAVGWLALAIAGAVVGEDGRVGSEPVLDGRPGVQRQAGPFSKTTTGAPEGGPASKDSTRRPWMASMEGAASALARLRQSARPARAEGM